MSVNVAILGSGIFASTAYLPALFSVSKSVTLHSVWSRSSSSVDSLIESAKSLKLPSSDTLKTYHGPEGLENVLSDKDVDAVLIVLPITAQPEIVRKAWKAGKHVLSEKPLHKDVAHARELVEEYEKDWKPKGLIWRVAENFAHEPILREAGRILANTPELGPILYWSLNMEGNIPDGSKYHATSWRTVPDYQGGFLLDGGVHWTAVLRTVLPSSAQPSTIISTASLHRTHLLPHDSILGLSLPSPSSLTPAHGPSTKLTSSNLKESDLPDVGKSGTHGSINFSFAIPDVDDEGKRPNGLYVTLLNGILKVEMPVGKREWQITLIPSKDSKLEKIEKRGKTEGVEVEIEQFGKAVLAKKQGKEYQENFGEPRGALWDLAIVQALLESNGKPIDIAQLIEQ